MDILQFEKQFLQLPSKIDEIHDELFEQKNVRVFIKRDDLIHPIISGNKWRKLRDYIELAQLNGQKHVISFGGAYSNHLYALAFVANKFKLSSTGVIRGEELTAESNIFLRQMKDWGMDLKFVTRTDYKQKFIPKEVDIQNALIIAEGGFGEIATKSVATIINETDESKYHHIFCPVGTGATYLGLCHASVSSNIHGILTLNNLEEIKSNAISLNIAIHKLYTAYIFGKYGNRPEKINEFCKRFEEKHGIKIEPIYTGKLFYGLYDLIQKDIFTPNSNILAIHTGGIKY
ncbi:1-aminocyclopropane-1-carboxylate deaminase/D-cysteine desulfhydrase [Aquirufa sp.]|jgi:1-aminocyclopropane-1-carboxylate deaminase|uniref:1-aminocyclopropane-1-carboxylate deaminase/D-cysteine desulfhydrase n=1 Tax=Aquirufa sp. TaxID=2676249 RepID=UPI0037C0CDD0